MPLKKIVTLTSFICVLTMSVNAQSLTNYNSFSKKTGPFAKLEVNLNNPCNDEIYLKLKEMNIDQMSDREFEIFKEKDKACNEFQKTRMTLEPENKTAESLQRAAKAGEVYIILAGIGVLVTAIYLIKASNELNDISY